MAPWFLLDSLYPHVSFPERFPVGDISVLQGICTSAPAIFMVRQMKLQNPKTQSFGSTNEIRYKPDSSSIHNRQLFYS